MLVIIIILFFLFSMAMGVPICIVLGASSIWYLSAEGLSLTIITQKVVAAMDSFILLTIPFFALAGSIMASSGTLERLVNLSRALVGHWRGGLAHVNVLGSMIFAGMSGTATADAAGLGNLEIPAMIKEGYDREFAVGLTASSSLIGPIIPPSLTMVIYGWLASVSVGKLFLGGIIPGVLMGLSLMIMVYWISKKRQYPKYPRASLREILIAFYKAFLSLLTIIIIVVGTLSGIFTPTEAGAVAAVYALFLAFFIFRTFNFTKLYKVLVDTAFLSSVILFLVGTAAAFAYMLIREQIPQHLSLILLSVIKNKYLILLVLNIFLLILGAFMDTIAIMVILIPTLMPLLSIYSIDPVHFGVVMTLNLVIGLCTPPFGLILFVIARVGELPVYRAIRAVLPFLIPLIIVLFLITYISPLVMFIPNLFIP